MTLAATSAVSSPPRSSTPSPAAGSARDVRRRQSMPLVHSSTPSPSVWFPPTTNGIERVAPFVFSQPPPMTQHAPGRGQKQTLASRAFAAILSPFRRRPTEGFRTAHIARSAPAISGAGVTSHAIDTYHSWESELSLASKRVDESTKRANHLSLAAAPVIRRSLSGTIVKRTRTPSAPRVSSMASAHSAVEPMLGKRQHALQLKYGSGAASRTSLAVSARAQSPVPSAAPQIALDFDWGPSASDLPSDALCASVDHLSEPVRTSSTVITTSSMTSSSMLSLPSWSRRPRGLSTSSVATSVAAITLTVVGQKHTTPNERQVESRRFSRAKSPPASAPNPLPRIELELIEDGFNIDFAVVEEEGGEYKNPGAWS